MAIFEGVELHIKKGDVITSKEGILIGPSEITGKEYLTYKLEYLGDGKWESIGIKIETESKKVSNK